MKVFVLDYRKFKKHVLLFGVFIICACIFSTLIYQQQILPATAKKYAIYKVQTDKKVAALTFDISWGTEVPGPVLDTLKEYNIKSTFFISGPWAVKHPEFPKRIVADGHEIASHGEEHVNLSEYSKADIQKNIITAQEKIKQVTGVTPNLIRTPNGDWNDLVLTTAEELNYKVIQWSTDSLDWKKPGVQAIVDRVLKNTHPGAIILMHASDTCLQTPAALPQVLDGLKQQGYQLVTVSELLTYGEGTID